MKVNLKRIGLFLIPLVFAGAIVSPVLTSEGFISADTATEISSLASITNPAGNYKLSCDITGGQAIIGASVGSKSNPFTGTLDGNGHTILGISINANSSYQGLFGYTKGATIKNIKIKNVSSTKAGMDYSLNTSPSEDEYFAGALVGYADSNTVISNCEVQDISVEEEIQYKTTIGGLVGCLTGGSRVENCVNYKNIKIKSNIKNIYTLKVGGIAGSVTDSSKLINVANFGQIVIDKTIDNKTNSNNIGGIVGEISDNLTSIFNGVSAGEISVEKTEEDLDDDYVGSVAGYVLSSPKSGNISSVAYIQNLNIFGNESGYNVSNIETNDYIALVPTTAVFVEDFYFAESYKYSVLTGVENTFYWYELSKGWNKDLWLMSSLSGENELRLQQFQSFTIKIADQVDYSGLLKAPIISQIDNVQYKQIASFDVSLANENNKGYYTITNILLNGEICDSELLAIGESQTKDIAYIDNLNGSYTLKVRASGATAGNYSFEVTPISFSGSLIVDSSVGGGSVKFAGGTRSNRTFTKSTSATTAEAKAGSMYVFKNWNLYYKTTEVDAKLEGVLKTGYIQDGTTYWKPQGAIYSSYTDENNYKYATASLNIKFGDTSTTFVGTDKQYKYLTKDFLLEAIFELDPYKFTFEKTNELSVSGVSQILVNEVDIVTTNGVASIGKSDVVKIEIYVTKGNELNTTILLESIQNVNKQPNVVLTETAVGEQKLYTLTFNTNKLDVAKMDENEHNKFVFNLMVNSIEDNSNKLPLGWIIGGSVGGTVILGVVIFLIIWFRGGIGGGKGPSLRAKAKQEKNDYKRYYM